MPETLAFGTLLALTLHHAAPPAGTSAGGGDVPTPVAPDLVAPDLVAPDPGTLAAASAPWTLDFAGPPECPSAETLRARLDTALDPRKHPRSPAHVILRVSPPVHDSTSPPNRPLWTLHAELHTADLTGTRSLQAASCEELMEASLLMVLIAIDPEADPELLRPRPVGPPHPPNQLHPPSPPERAEDEATQTAPSPPRPLPMPAAQPAEHPPSPASGETRSAGPRRPASLPTRRPRAHWEVSGRGFVSLRNFPRPAPGVGFSAAAVGRRWEASAGVLVVPFTVAEAPKVPGARAELTAFGVEGRGCGVLRAGPTVSFPLCAGLAGGGLSGRGAGPSVDASRATTGWLALIAGPTVRIAADKRVALGLRADFVAMLARPNLVITGAGRVCCQRAIGATLSLEVSVRGP